MYINIIKSYREVVVVSDKELLGKKFEQQDKKGFVKQLDVKENFYKGREISEGEIIEIMKSFAKEDATFNIVGEKSVDCALKAGIITEDSVDRIQNVPFALVLL